MVGEDLQAKLERAQAELQKALKSIHDLETMTKEELARMRARNERLTKAISKAIPPLRAAASVLVKGTHEENVKSGNEIREALDELSCAIGDLDEMILSRPKKVAAK